MSLIVATLVKKSRDFCLTHRSRGSYKEEESRLVLVE